jgi:hypothetical protein
VLEADLEPHSRDERGAGKKGYKIFERRVVWFPQAPDAEIVEGRAGELAKEIRNFTGRFNSPRTAILGNGNVAGPERFQVREGAPGHVEEMRGHATHCDGEIREVRCRLANANKIIGGGLVYSQVTQPGARELEIRGRCFQPN